MTVYLPSLTKKNAELKLLKKIFYFLQLVITTLIFCNLINITYIMYY